MRLLLTRGAAGRRLAMLHIILLRPLVITRKVSQRGDRYLQRRPGWSTNLLHDHKCTPYHQVLLAQHRRVWVRAAATGARLHDPTVVAVLAAAPLR
jgi:hypothetical protein